MQRTMTAQLEQLVRLRHEPPAEVIAEAVELGMSKLYKDVAWGLSGRFHPDLTNSRRRVVY